MGKHLRLLGTLAVAAALLLAGCGGDDGGSTGGGNGQALRVVATTTQVQDFARIIGGDRVQVTGILKPNVDAHDYEPSPADLDAIARADVLVENGVGLEEWLQDTIQSAGFDGTLVDASQGVRLREGGEEHAEEEAGGEEHAEEGKDPHIWMDPRNAKLMVANIERGFAEARPADAASFEANLDSYTTQLDALDASIAERIGGLANKKLVTNHDAFHYYVDRYGLEFVGSIIPSFDTSAELSAKSVQDLVARIKATRVKAIFSESSLPPETAEAIGREAGIKVVAGEDALYGDALGPAGSEADTYLKMMEHNTSTIVAALSGT
jgi:ABC-type Zn uptake system ZnuABC Zn-binding protein ZnuA